MADFAAIRFQPQRPLLRELSADRLNSILAEIKRNKPLPGRGITVRQTGQGTAIDLATTIKSGGVESDTHPFQISAALNSSTNNYSATIRPGTLNQLLPTNTFNGAALRSFAYNANQLKYVVLSAQSDSTQFTTCSLELADQAPATQTPALYSLPTQVSFLIGILYNSSVYQVIKNNIVVSGSEAFRTAKTSPAPGEVAFNVYYAWK